MSRILVVVQWEIKVDQVLCCSFNANGAIWHYIGKGLEPVFWSRGSTAEHTKHTLKHTASVDFTPVDFANTEQALFRWILHQWILQIHSTHCFVGFCTSGFCKYRTGTASLDFAPLFVRAQLRQSHTLHKPFILIRSHSIHWSLQYNHPCQYCWSNPCSKGRYVWGGFISDWVEIDSDDQL